MKKLLWIFFFYVCIFVGLTGCVEKSFSLIEIGIGISNGGTYRNGDTITIVPDYAYEKIDSVSYYWDNKHMLTFKQMPFVWKFLVENMDTGVYVCQYKVYTSGEAYQEWRTVSIKLEIEE